ncbi:MAG: hypothetical protein KDD25_02185, partial [Bdellovibrionales bacterium]|nr:hypothetical protein [Bdellovibrionales bacterium]
MKIWTILFSFSILINTHSTAFAQKENVDLDDILQEDDVTSDEPDTLDLGGPEEQNPENVNPEDQVEPSFQATEPTPPEPT